MEVHRPEKRGIPLFLYTASDNDRRSDRQMSELRMRIRLHRYLIGQGELFSWKFPFL